jgi:muramoyltetrapeptide carboxypeptidase
MGFSDITVLLSTFYDRLGWVGLYSPMLASNLIVADQDWTRQQWLRTTGAESQTLPFEVHTVGAPYEALIPNTVEAPLYVANLTLLASLCGTPYQPNVAGHLLVLEDWKESDYSLDRQFTQLKQAGFFNNLAGLLFADWAYTTRQCEQPLPQLLASFVEGCPIPAMGFGWMLGHGEQTTTLPMGTMARFDASRGTLTLIEPFLEATLA